MSTLWIAHRLPPWNESLAILMLGSGYYTNREKAYQLFDHYINLKKTIRSLYYNSKEKMLEA